MVNTKAYRWQQELSTHSIRLIENKFNLKVMNLIQILVHYYNIMNEFYTYALKLKYSHVQAKLGS